MKEHNIVLVSLYRNQNFAVRTIHSVLKGINGIKPYSIFYKDSVANISARPTIKEEKLFIRKIIELNPTVVGISVLSSYATIARRLTRLIKDNSSALVVWGGVHPTICPESCIEEADIICMGEGEEAFEELIMRLRDGKEYAGVKNLWIKDKGNVVKNPMRPLMQDLNGIPFPSYGSDSFFFIENNRITRSDPTLLDDRLQIMSSRGCPFACSFCVNSLMRPLFKELGSYTRRRSVKSVIDEIKQQLAFSGNIKKQVVFTDEVFAWDISWIKEFESLYKKEVKIPFCAIYNPRVLNPEIFARLVSAGLVKVYVGIQSGSDNIRNKLFNRLEKNGDIIRVDRMITGSGVQVMYDLIIDNPYETEETLKDGINFLLQLTRPLRFSCFRLQYFPTYPITQKAIHDEYVRAEDLTEERLFKKSTESWMFDPALFPCTDKTSLQNIIWLIIWNYTKGSIVKYAMSGDSFNKRVCLFYLNLKAVFLGKIFGKGGIKRKIIQKYAQARYMLHIKVRNVS